MECAAIVLLDDDLETLEMYGYMLERAGYEVRKVSRGAELLQLLKDEVPSAVVMHLGLPDAPGVELCRTIRRTKGCAQVPIIGITGWSSGPVIDGLRDAPFNEVFLKPLEPQRLLDALRRWIARPAVST